MRRILTSYVVLMLILQLFQVMSAGGVVTVISYAMYRTMPGFGLTPPPDSTTRFTQIDEAAWLWFRYKTTTETNITARWIRPDGILYSSESSTLKSGDWTSRRKLEIRGTKAANYLGKWIVKISANEGWGEYELFQQSFTIDAATSAEKDIFIIVNEKQELHVEMVAAYHTRGESWQVIENFYYLPRFSPKRGRIINLTVSDFETREMLEPDLVDSEDWYQLRVLFKRPKIGDFKLLYTFDWVDMVKNLGGGQYRLEFEAYTYRGPILQRFTVKLPPRGSLVSFGGANYTQVREEGRVVLTFESISPPVGKSQWWVSYYGGPIRTFSDSTNDLFDRQGKPVTAEPYLDIVEARLIQSEAGYLARMKMNGALPSSLSDPSIFIEWDLLIDVDRDQQTHPWGSWPLIDNGIGVDMLVRLTLGPRGEGFKAEVYDLSTRTAKRIEFKVDGATVQFAFPSSLIGNPKAFDYVFAVRKFGDFGRSGAETACDKSPNGGYFSWAPPPIRVVRRTLCRQLGDPPEYFPRDWNSTEFYRDDKSIFCWFEAVDVPANTEISFKWYRPDGTLFKEENRPGKDPPPRYYGTLISVTEAMLGKWRVDVYADEYLLFSIPFELKERGPPTLAYLVVGIPALCAVTLAMWVILKRRKRAVANAAT